MHLLSRFQTVDHVIVDLHGPDADVACQGIDEGGKDAGVSRAAEDCVGLAGVGDSVAEDEAALACIGEVVPFWRETAMVSAAMSRLKSA